MSLIILFMLSLSSPPAVTEGLVAREVEYSEEEYNYLSLSKVLGMFNRLYDRAPKTINEFFDFIYADEENISMIPEDYLRELINIRETFSIQLIPYKDIGLVANCDLVVINTTNTENEIQPVADASVCNDCYTLKSSNSWPKLFSADGSYLYDYPLRDKFIQEYSDISKKFLPWQLTDSDLEPRGIKQYCIDFTIDSGFRDFCTGKLFNLDQHEYYREVGNLIWSFVEQHNLSGVRFVVYVPQID